MTEHRILDLTLPESSFSFATTTTHGAVDPTQREVVPSTILVGYSGSEAARNALVLATRLFPSAQAIIALLQQTENTQVARHLIIGDRPNRWPTRAVQRQPSEVVSAGVAIAAERGIEAVPVAREVSTSIAWGLAALADEYDAQAIVVGRRAQKAFFERMLPDTPSILSRVCSRPLLIVPLG